MENRTEIVEFPELIAVRVPPGDKWMDFLESSTQQTRS